MGLSYTIIFKSIVNALMTTATLIIKVFPTGPILIAELHPSLAHLHACVKLESTLSICSSANVLFIILEYSLFSFLVMILQPSSLRPNRLRLISLSPAQLFITNGPSTLIQYLQLPTHFCKPVPHSTS